MTPITRRASLLALAAAPLFTVALPAVAQDAYPSKPITIVVPFAAGGGVDVTARILAERLRVSLGQVVNVDNKPGSSGMLGALAAVRAPADGYTLLLASAGEVAINPHVFKGRMQYDPERDLAPLTSAVKVPNVLVVNPKLPIQSVADLLAYAKQHPSKLSYGSSGIGNPQHLNGELLEQMSGQALLHVPYKGAAAQLTDTAAGNVDFTFVSLTGARPFMKDNRVRAIAMTSPKRTPLAPELPAVAETKGLEAYALENWFGFFVNAGTPVAVQQKLNTAIVAALKDPDVVKRLQELGGDPAPLSQEQFRAFVKAESAKLARIVEIAKVTVDN